MKVGLATVDVTPPAGLPMMGNFRDDYAARGVHDPLHAKALVLADCLAEKAAILSVDVCMLDRDNVALIRRTVAAQCDVPPEHVLVHATHTHSGPATNERYSFGMDFAPHRTDVEQLLVKAASAVALANNHLADATLAIGYAREDRLAFNRRLRRKEGSTQMNWEALSPGFDPSRIEAPWGPTDPEVACLAVEQSGRPTAAVVNFALHPAILAGDNWLYSADYPGYVAEALARTLGREFTCVYLNGCCGNVNHIDYRDPLQGRGYPMAQRVGYMLAAAACQAIHARVPVMGDRIAVSRKTVSLPRIQIDRKEQQRCRRVLKEASRGPLQGQVDGLPDAFFADLRLKMAAQQQAPDEVEVMVLRIGEVGVVGLPGENFCESGLELKRGSPTRHTLTAGLANDAIGYLPRREAFQQGGYEPTVGSTAYEPGAAERLVEAAAVQLDRLFVVR
jgi:hypothetical protein